MTNRFEGEGTGSTSVKSVITVTVWTLDISMEGGTSGSYPCWNILGLVLRLNRGVGAEVSWWTSGL